MGTAFARFKPLPRAGLVVMIGGRRVAHGLHTSARWVGACGAGRGLGPTRAGMEADSPKPLEGPTGALTMGMSRAPSGGPRAARDIRAERNAAEHIGRKRQEGHRWPIFSES